MTTPSARRRHHRRGRRARRGDLAPARRRARHRPRAQRRQRALARGDRRRPPGDRRRGRDGARRRERRRPGRGRGGPGRRALRPPRRADQQRRRALAERPHPQPGHRGLGAGVPGQRPRRGQRHQGRGGGHAPAGVGLDRADRVGVRPHGVVARRALLRDEGGGDPARQGRGGRVRPRRHPGELRVPGDVPVGHPRRPARRRRSTPSRRGTRSGWARPATSSGPTRTSPATPPAGRPARPWSSTAATPAP